MSIIPHSREAWAWLTTRLFVGAVAVCLAAGLVIQGVILAEIRSQQQADQAKVTDTHRAAVDAERLLQIVLDCQRPGGKCHAANQANQRAILAQAGQIFIYVALCQGQSSTGSYPAMAACLARQIKEHGLG